MSTGDTGVRCGGVNLITSVLLLCISSHTLGHIYPFPLRRTHGNSDVRDIISVKISKCDCEVCPKKGDLGPIIWEAIAVLLTLTTMNPFPMHSGGGTPAILTIAGSDSGGGAGIQVSRRTKIIFLLVFDTDELQADLKTFTSLGCYGASAVTALTAQNTKGVQAIHAVPPSFVEEQVRCRPQLRHGITPAETTLLIAASISLG
jgi:hypothetical protein